jgi:hypothetical protein
MRAQRDSQATIYPFATAEGEIAKQVEAFTITMEEPRAHLAEIGERMSKPAHSSPGLTSRRILLSINVEQTTMLLR